MPKFHSLLALPALLMGGCKDTEEPHEHNEHEVITTVVLSFAPASGGEPTLASWADPEDDGSPVIDDIALSDAEDYTLTVSFLNELEDPPEDITAEVAEESDEHQVFFTGSAVGPVVTQTYEDTDAAGLPVGLENTIATVAPGTGTFIVTLRHMPPENDTPVKVDGLAEQAASEGLDGLPGDSDVSVTFDLAVQ
jgi:hypothetical protein